jgi:hypothetical protein
MLPPFTETPFGYNGEHEMSAERPAWSEERALSMVGARVLIGITRNDASGQHLEQMFGTVVSADEVKGFEIALEGSRAGEKYRLPPDLPAFQPAAPGIYRLKSTQEEVIDPDYIATWIIHPPRN